MYCKSLLSYCRMIEKSVLIVAKCIVNSTEKEELYNFSNSINSSKVYCKLNFF